MLSHLGVQAKSEFAAAKSFSSKEACGVKPLCLHLLIDWENQCNGNPNERRIGLRSLEDYRKPLKKCDDEIW
jgi:hypothetical protein